MLSNRKATILKFAVEDYISNALPITSGQVKEKSLSGISSATLRAELNALEAMGYLKQLHVSGGRIPTPKAYEFYVNLLLSSNTLEKTKLEGVKAAIKSRTSSISELVSEIAKLVSEQTNLPTVVFLNSYEKLLIESVNIIKLIGDSLLLLIKTKEGVVHLALSSKSNEKTLQDCSYYLTKHFEGKTIGALLAAMTSGQEQIKQELAGFEEIVESMVNVLTNLLTKGTLNVRRDGSAKLLCDSKNSFDDTKNLISLLENEDMLKESVQVKDASNGITCEIADHGEKKGCAIIKAPIVIGDDVVASVSVLGPQRMDYASIASVLKFVMDEMSDPKILIDESDKKG